MKLLLFSGGGYFDNMRLMEELVTMAFRKHPRILYIPSDGDDDDYYEDYTEFNMAINQVTKTETIYLPIDDKLTPHDFVQKLASSDGVFLSGGNTFHFLGHLRKKGLLSKLKLYARQGNLLSGLSAGAIILTPSVETAGFPEFDCDINYDEITNLRSLNLTRFLFFPHFKKSKRYSDAFRLETLARTQYPIYCCPDYSGIKIFHNTVTFYGNCWGYFCGHEFRVN